ncbi:DUF4123 domain-containing protein [Cupriavidus gilardii]|uniref:DUF4123 domain-containing protein n=1 Tax=Cupriavidus gilardii TaxID=82541 RepID=UPI001EE5FEF5|nr:DUF4123 domain-containing protein [Cupriavidus gilardii]MCG5263404.1 DUF4123 domain-containing protein [Cupriavidus gilardii]MDF9432148.1 DUF4123 domain-containing protein [Cupriavidus gilardii]
MPRDSSPLWDSIEALPLRPEGAHRYLLVNQAAIPGQRPLLTRLTTLPCQPLFGQDTDACYDGATPFVVCIDNALASPSGMLAELADAACYGCALSIIDTPLDLRGIARALTARTDVLLPDGDVMLLRFFDTRIFMALIDVLDDEQRDQFLSCATEWWYADREGAMVPSARLNQDGMDRYEAPLRMNRTQERAMIEAAEPDAVIDLLLSRGTTSLLALPYPLRYPTVLGLLHRARAWGLNDLPDLAAFSLLALYGPSDFDTLPPWNDLLPLVKRGELTFPVAIERAHDAEQGE